MFQESGSKVSKQLANGTAQGTKTWNVAGKCPTTARYLSHVGGDLADYMMTDCRSRAGYPCSCTYIKNYVYYAMYDECRTRTLPTTNSLLHAMLTSWGQYPQELASGHERLGDVFVITVARCFCRNDWRPLYQLVEYATLHEMRNLLQQKNPSKNDAELLQMAADSVNFVRKYSLTKAGIGPPVPLEKGIEGTSATRPVNTTGNGMEAHLVQIRARRIGSSNRSRPRHDLHRRGQGRKATNSSGDD